VIQPLLLRPSLPRLSASKPRLMRSRAAFGLVKTMRAGAIIRLELRASPKIKGGSDVGESISGVVAVLMVSMAFVSGCQDARSRAPATSTGPTLVPTTGAAPSIPGAGRTLSPNLAAPFVPRTGQFDGGMSDAEVQRLGGGAPPPGGTRRQ
jgi:hypothetical protein